MNSIHPGKEKFMNGTDLGKFKKKQNPLVELFFIFFLMRKYFGWVDSGVCRFHEHKLRQHEGPRAEVTKKGRTLLRAVKGKKKN